MNRRHFFLFAASFWAGSSRVLQGRATTPARPRGKLMWDPFYLELPPESKAPWDQWLAEGARLRQQEIAFFSDELARSGQRQASAAKEAAPFEVPQKPAAWFAGAGARKIADNLLSWQTPSGGWTKNTAMKKRPRAPGQRWSPWGEWGYVATIDNKATTSQIEFLARAASATGKDTYRDAAGRGMRYLLAAQMPCGGWPQVFPLQGTYHDQITFNDDAMIQVLNLLRDIKNRKEPWKWVGSSLRQSAGAAVQAGIGCILRCQVRSGGTLTSWCAQHHPITLEPVGARVYELPSLSGRETVGIVKLLIDLGNPGPEVKDAVEAAVAWLRRSVVDGPALGGPARSGPQWARFYEIGTNRPLFSDQDGEKRYSFREVKIRRNTYSWFTDTPANLLEVDYPKWRRKHGAASRSK